MPFEPLRVDHWVNHRLGRIHETWIRVYGCEAVLQPALSCAAPRQHRLCPQISAGSPGADAASPDTSIAIWSPTSTLLKSTRSWYAKAIHLLPYMGRHCSPERPRRSAFLCAVRLWHASRGQRLRPHRKICTRLHRKIPNLVVGDGSETLRMYSPHRSENSNVDFGVTPMQSRR